MAVDLVTIRDGRLAALMVGEPIARRIEGVDLSLRLGPQYKSLVLDIAGGSLFSDIRTHRIGIYVKIYTVRVYTYLLSLFGLNQGRFCNTMNNPQKIPW